MSTVLVSVIKLHQTRYRVTQVWTSLENSNPSQKLAVMSLEFKQLFANLKFSPEAFVDDLTPGGDH